MKSRLSQVLVGIATILLLLRVANAGEPELKFKADGTFKILQMSDTHYIAILDTKGLALIEMLLDTEKPDFVVVNGDCLSGHEPNGNHTVNDVKQAIAHVADPLEQRKIPWAITFGNHDNEHADTSHLTKEDVLNIYASYPYNLNGGWQKGIHGGGNKNLLVWNANPARPVFALWLLDSGDEAEPRWIHTDQVCWYYHTSEKLEKQHGQKIPGLMFFHIPLPELRDLVAATKVVEPGPEQTNAQGVRRPRVNGGLFAAVLDRGDVKGIFWGHSHEHSFMREWMGVKMGFDSVVGYRGYPHLTPDYSAPDFKGYPPESEEDPAIKTSRGARVFVIQESDPENWKSWMRLGDGTVKND